MRRGSVTQALAVALLAVLAGATGCSVEPEADVSSGTAESDSFKELVDAYDLALPSDVDDLEWVDTNDWDSNHLYLHMSADEDVVQTVLSSYAIYLQDAKAYRRGLCSSALPRSSDWVDQLPDGVARWHPPSGVVVRCGEGHGPGILWADALVVGTDGQAQELFLHLTK